ncbi:MAG: nucleotidyltransferase family protein [Flavobacterium sp.]
MNISAKNIETIKTLCNSHQVRFLAAFGSVTRDDFNKDSDIDFVVDFNESDPLLYSDLYFDLKDKLELLLNRTIDLVEDRALKNPYFKKELNHTKIILYGTPN